ncbi:hypothetical protein COW36_14395 [bacterium (Candidatus Blackallbacteria) CG17_big_fil_post_rev_8_21_14_2_50_48_46]|uniref:Mucoidy inhibitor MuiA family protein n=1 Tax=bacterium (Candidatus Blackallbacteria) CG17_big_fil_post_rev_8_21_14_2_50_48_46 TaxID=2014261 RepID=A0A2M7G2X0_9BACT|nr:MAG: hypothetical protein COW64_08920 [bacterium (Candidatus Blackallbacteria) CG18_big_fil_WC_8_21_14_2_50_49_26]PIW16150.1 MAG: hypothetical protein COW36_14395 [bacterium (Candidatus Blackallbacteria) CG17_big_fil_post_rev_8_21_14_2_50_48_46]PIW44237.1 MAG: hypothetical protein COW20_24725 [bacterium (Candidatus Blackallbacteria) CG13_big_fil_rev_8_21_14_2_50_49_14]
MKRLSLSLILALSLQPALQAETLQELSHSPIEKVTAYQGQGIVSREAKTTLKAPGDYRLRISDIPLNIVGDSLHVKALGSNNITIHTVQLMPLPPGQENSETQKLRVQLKDLENKLAKLENTHQLNQRSQQWLNSYWSQVSNKSTAYPQPAEWQKTLDFLSLNQGRILESETQVNAQKQVLQIKLAEVQKKLAEQTSRMQNKTQAAVVYFTAKTAGEINFQLSYLIAGIHWTPSYDARLDEKAGKLSLTYYGDLVQQTGESWNDVELSLSTSAPQLNAAVPLLEPWVITDRMPALEQNRQMLNGPASQFRDEAPMEAETSSSEEDLDGSGYAESEVQTQGLSVIFAIPQKVSIESSPHARRVAIATRSFKFEPEYQVVPKLSRRVYMRARFRNTGDLPLLAGQIRNYVDLDYTGTSQIPLVRPNEEASLNFGIDENIRVQRREGTDQNSLIGLMRDTRRREMSYEIEVSNYKSKPVKVMVWDHLPLIRHDQIRLQVLNIQPKAQEQTKNNLLRWELELKPQEKQIIKVSYAVEHPTSLEVYSNFTNEIQSPRRKNMQRQQYEKF